MLAGRSRSGSPMRRTIRVVPTSGARWMSGGASEPVDGIDGDGGSTAADTVGAADVSAPATGSGDSEAAGTAGAVRSRAGNGRATTTVGSSVDAAGIRCTPAAGTGGASGDEAGGGNTSSGGGAVERSAYTGNTGATDAAASTIRGGA